MVRYKYREEEEKKRLLRRLKVMEGQLRGVSKMIEADRYCADVLIQISAISQGLKSLGNEMLKSHFSSCVVKDIQENHLEAVDSMFDLFMKFNR